jgi:hypothetical protein
MSTRSEHVCAACGATWGVCDDQRVTRMPCEPARLTRVQPDVHTEPNDLGTGHVHAAGAIGQVSLRDYLAMVAPGAILIQKREVSWMLFVVFLAGGIVGSLLSRLLA